jgi:hypothetical protein
VTAKEKIRMLAKAQSTGGATAVSTIAKSITKCYIVFSPPTDYHAIAFNFISNIVFTISNLKS